MISCCRDPQLMKHTPFHGIGRQRKKFLSLYRGSDFLTRCNSRKRFLTSPIGRIQGKCGSFPKRFRCACPCRDSSNRAHASLYRSAKAGCQAEKFHRHRRQSARRFCQQRISAAESIRRSGESLARLLRHANRRCQTFPESRPSRGRSAATETLQVPVHAPGLPVRVGVRQNPSRPSVIVAGRWSNRGRTRAFSIFAES